MHIFSNTHSMFKFGDINFLLKKMKAYDQEKLSFTKKSPRNLKKKEKSPRRGSKKCPAGENFGFLTCSKSEIFNGGRFKWGRVCRKSEISDFQLPKK